MEYKKPLILLVVFFMLAFLGAAFYFVILDGRLPLVDQKPESGPRTVFSEPVRQEEKDIIPPPPPEETKPKVVVPGSSEIEEGIIPSPPPPAGTGN